MIIERVSSILRNKKGASDVLSLVIIAPIITWFIVYIILSCDFFMTTNDLSVIVNKKMARAIVNGQFTTELKQELIDELVEKGFDKSYLDISITPNSAGDNNNTTYEKRGNEIEIVVIYKNPHALYYVNLGTVNRKNYCIGTKLQGMSEKW